MPRPNTVACWPVRAMFWLALCLPGRYADNGLRPYYRISSAVCGCDNPLSQQMPVPTDSRPTEYPSCLRITILAKPIYKKYNI
ncbi:hypothetical protein J6590_022298 [Homalodisca vitripennis]|nr:hypothetical protein J6590_022298 [Homalodisca vitripennis]